MTVSYCTVIGDISWTVITGLGYKSTGNVSSIFTPVTITSVVWDCQISQGWTFLTYFTLISVQRVRPDRNCTQYFHNPDKKNYMYTTTIYLRGVGASKGSWSTCHLQATWPFSPDFSPHFFEWMGCHCLLAQLNPERTFRVFLYVCTCIAIGFDFIQNLIVIIIIRGNSYW